MQTITQKEIGRRISDLRRKKGLSQNSLAQILNLSRSSVTQIEHGKRNINVFELKIISDTFTVSIDKLLSAEYSAMSDEYFINNEYKSITLRESTPKLNLIKSINVILYILEKCAAKVNFDDEFLNRILYFSDFNFYELYEEHLTGLKYLKFSQGPIAEEFADVLKYMEDNNYIENIKSESSRIPLIRRIPLIKSDLCIFRANEIAVIDKVIEHYSDWSLSLLNEFSRNDMPYKAVAAAEIIDYELAFYREYPYTVRLYNEIDD